MSSHSARYLRRARKVLLASTSALTIYGSLAPFAMAQQFPGVQAPAEEEIEPRRGFEYDLTVSPRLTYSDNLNLQTDSLPIDGDRTADLSQEGGIASVELSGGLLLDRMRFSGLVSGSLEVGSYFDEPVRFDTTTGEAAETLDQFVIDQDVRAAGTATLAKNLLYLDVAASAQQRALDDDTAFSATSIAASEDQAKVFSYSASPYVFRQLINGSSVEARYRYTGVRIDDSEAARNVDDFLNDSESHEVLAEYDSGKLLDRVGFSLRAYGTTTDEDGSDVLDGVDFEQLAVSADVRYPLSRRLAVTGTVGHDDIDTGDSDLFDDDKLSGVFWKAGLLATPGRRTRAQLEVGERYDGSWVEADATYRYSSRLQFRARLDRSFQTQAQALGRSVDLFQNETLTYADQLRQLQGQASGRVLDGPLFYNTEYQDLNRLQAGLSRSDRFTFSTIARTGRTDFVISAGVEDADFGFQETNSRILAGSVDHQLSRNISLYGKGNWQFLENSLIDCLTALANDPQFAGLPSETLTALCEGQDNAPTETQTYSVLGGLRYELNDRLATFGEVSHTTRTADDPIDEYTENAVTLGMSFRF